MGEPAAEDLWPSLDKSLTSAMFPSGKVWSVLPTLKGQIIDMLEDVGSNLREGVSVDETKGKIHIDDSASIEPSVYIIPHISL